MSRESQGRVSFAPLGGKILSLHYKSLHDRSSVSMWFPYAFWDCYLPEKLPGMLLTHDNSSILTPAPSLPSLHSFHCISWTYGETSLLKRGFNIMELDECFFPTELEKEFVYMSSSNSTLGHVQISTDMQYMVPLTHLWHHITHAGIPLLQYRGVFWPQEFPGSKKPAP